MANFDGSSGPLNKVNGATGNGANGSEGGSEENGAQYPSLQVNLTQTIN